MTKKPQVSLWCGVVLVLLILYWRTATKQDVSVKESFEPSTGARGINSETKLAAPVQKGAVLLSVI